MFTNLIESSSHTKEYKRRGSFVLFTAATYVVLFVVAGVASVYAYDAHLEAQTTELVTLLSPQEFVTERQAEVTTRPGERPRATSANESTIALRTDPMLSVDHSEVVPTGVSTTANTNLVLPPADPWARRNDFTPGSVAGPGSTGNGSRVTAAAARVVELPDPPAALPDPPKPPLVISKGVITTRAIFLPKPAYSEIAKRMHIQGTVNVQVLVDVDGKVISARALSGNALLIPAAQKAALQARFSPMLMSNQPVKVSGVITYNFVLSF